MVTAIRRASPLDVQTVLFRNQNKIRSAAQACDVSAMICVRFIFLGRAALPNDRLLKEVIDGLPFSVVAIDSHDNIVLWNKASEGVFGWRSFEVLGKPPASIVPVDRLDEFRAFTEIARTGKSLQIRTRRQRKDGAPIDVKATVIPLHDDSGDVKYVMAVHEPVGAAEDSRDQSKTPSSTRAELVLSRFTPRQRQIIKLVAAGHKNGAIAKRVSVNEQVIKNYLSGIYRELRIHSRTELIVWVNQQMQDR